MNASIDYGMPKQTFWTAYQELWDNSQYKSAFQAPAFVRLLARLTKYKTAVYRYYAGNKLMGAAFFKNQDGEHRFLSDLKTDHNFFVIDRQCSEEQIRDFFACFVREIKKDDWALLLDKQPSWASYRQALLDAIKNSDRYWEISKYSVCLSLEEDEPEKLLSYFDRQKLPQKLNRLKKLGTFKFEFFEEDEDLEQWTEDYFNLHINRWKDTNTPSNFTKAGRRKFLRQCLKAWIREGVLVRFSMVLDGKRIGFVIGLRENNSLVHHSTTYDNEYRKYSPGLVITRLVGQWMAKQNIYKLDFGDGNEAYKHYFSNTIGEIDRIYVSNTSNYPFIVKAKITKAVRENPKFHRFYKEKIKPLTKKVFQ